MKKESMITFCGLSDDSASWFIRDFLLNYQEVETYLKEKRNLDINSWTIEDFKMFYYIHNIKALYNDLKNKKSNFKSETEPKIQEKCKKLFSLIDEKDFITLNLIKYINEHALVIKDYVSKTKNWFSYEYISELILNNLQLIKQPNYDYLLYFLKHCKHLFRKYPNALLVQELNQAFSKWICEYTTLRNDFITGLNYLDLYVKYCIDNEQRGQEILNKYYKCIMSFISYDNNHIVNIHFLKIFRNKLIASKSKLNIIKKWIKILNLKINDFNELLISSKYNWKSIIMKSHREYLHFLLFSVNNVLSSPKPLFANLMNLTKTSTSDLNSLLGQHETHNYIFVSQIYQNLYINMILLENVFNDIELKTSYYENITKKLIYFFSYFDTPVENVDGFIGKLTSIFNDFATINDYYDGEKLDSQFYQKFNKKVCYMIESILKQVYLIVENEIGNDTNISLKELLVSHFELKEGVKIYTSNNLSFLLTSEFKLILHYFLTCSEENNGLDLFRKYSSSSNAKFSISMHKFYANILFVLFLSTLEKVIYNFFEGVSEVINAEQFIEQCISKNKSYNVNLLNEEFYHYLKKIARSCYYVIPQKIYLDLAKNHVGDIVVNEYINGILVEQIILGNIKAKQYI